jgi:ribosomal protein L18E
MMEIQTSKLVAASALLPTVKGPVMAQLGAKVRSYCDWAQCRLLGCRKLGRVLAFFALVIVAGCSQSAADKAEVEFLKTYADFKMKTKGRDSTRSGLEAWSSRLHEARRKVQQINIQRSYHELATKGTLGKTEALVVAGKMLDDSTYEQRIYSSTSELDREIAFALERVNRLTTELEEENTQAAQLLPGLRSALERYEVACTEDALVNGEKKRQSLKVQDAIKDTQSMISDEWSRLWNQKWEKSKQKDR